MMYDTDILIWFIRGNDKAAGALEKDSERSLSIQSYMELLQGAQDAAHLVISGQRQALVFPPVEQFSQGILQKRKSAGFLA